MKERGCNSKWKRTGRCKILQLAAGSRSDADVTGLTAGNKTSWQPGAYLSACPATMHSLMSVWHGLNPKPDTRKAPYLSYSLRHAGFPCRRVSQPGSAAMMPRAVPGSGFREYGLKGLQAEGECGHIRHRRPVPVDQVAQRGGAHSRVMHFARIHRRLEYCPLAPRASAPHP